MDRKQKQRYKNMEYAGFGTLISRDLDLSFPVPDRFFKKYKNSDQIEEALFKIMNKGLVGLTFDGSGLEDDDKYTIDYYLQARDKRRVMSRKEKIEKLGGTMSKKQEIEKISREISQIKSKLAATDNFEQVKYLIDISFSLEQKYIQQQIRDIKSWVKDFIWEIDTYGSTEVEAYKLAGAWMEGGWEEQMYHAGYLEDLMDLDPDLELHNKLWEKKMWPQYQKLAKRIQNELKKQGYDVGLDLKMGY